MVSVDKFDSVVEELNQTLAREKRAQQPLDEQTTKLRDMSRVLEDEELKRSEQENKLKDLLRVCTVLLGAYWSTLKQGKAIPNLIYELFLNYAIFEIL